MGSQWPSHVCISFRLKSTGRFCCGLGLALALPPSGCAKSRPSAAGSLLTEPPAAPTASSSTAKATAPPHGPYLAALPIKVHAMSAAAKRAVGTVAVSRCVEARGGQRLNRQAWQDIRRACRLAEESERVRAVTIHCVYISFSKAVPRHFCHGNNQCRGWLHLSGVASINSEVAVGARAIAEAAEFAAGGGARSGWKYLTMAKRRQLKQHWLLRLPRGCPKPRRGT